MHLADIINACERKYRAVGLTGLTTRERLVVLASRANFEIELGGMAGFFHGASGAHARETVDALIALGAMDEAAAVNDGRELLRNHSWEASLASGRFERLTDKFMASMPGVTSRLADFIELYHEELAAQEGATEDARTVGG